MHQNAYRNNNSYDMSRIMTLGDDVSATGETNKQLNDTKFITNEISFMSYDKLKAPPS